MNDIIERIKQKLAYLREHEDFDETDAATERGSQVYAAKRYRYVLKAPASETQIAVFEAKYEIRFPDDYRRFLLEVGTGGAGPGYDLLSPLDDMLSQEEADRFFDRLDEPDAEIDDDEFWKEDAPVIGDLKTPFPFVDRMTVAAVDELISQQGWEIIAPLLMAGQLLIGYTGCQCWYLLIVSGAAYGQIWYMDGGTYFSPVMVADGKFYHSDKAPANAERVTLTRWYEAWLDEEIAIAQNHWQKRGRSVPSLTLTEND
jgi:hypothetical protein